MAHVGRSIRVVIGGWVAGFLVAVVWGTTRANNGGHASFLSGWAILGLVVIGVLLLGSAVSELVGRRRVARDTAPRTASVVFPATAADEATATERQAATRIAELEARLAIEEAELETAAASLAAAEAPMAGQPSAGIVFPASTDRAVELEPELREEVVETVAGLIATSRPEEAATLLAGAIKAKRRRVR